MIKKDVLQTALMIIGNQDRFLKKGRYLLCKEVYGDEREESASATEMECTDYFEEGVDELYNAIKKIEEKQSHVYSLRVDSKTYDAWKEEIEKCNRDLQDEYPDAELCESKILRNLMRKWIRDQKK